MEQLDENKKRIVIPIISFLIGAILASIITILIIPENECPVCEEPKEIEIKKVEDSSILDKDDRAQVKSSTVEIITENQPIVSESTVSLPISDCSTTVDISGAVKEPGVYCFSKGSRIVDAVKKAQGFQEGVAYRYVSMKMNLSELISNHQKIYIPFEEDVYCELKNLQYVDTQKKPMDQENESNNTSDSTQTCININTAEKDQLTTLDGIGESTAQKIIEARPYSKVEDILNVSGIGESTYAKFKDDICVY